MIVKIWEFYKRVEKYFYTWKDLSLLIEIYKEFNR